jgi:hypothetical protein
MLQWSIIGPSPNPLELIQFHRLSLPPRSMAVPWRSFAVQQFEPPAARSCCAVPSALPPTPSAAAKPHAGSNGTTGPGRAWEGWGMRLS